MAGRARGVWRHTSSRSPANGAETRSKTLSKGQRKELKNQDKYINDTITRQHTHWLGWHHQRGALAYQAGQKQGEATPEVTSVAEPKPRGSKLEGL